MPEVNEDLKKIAKETEEWAAKQKLLRMSEISLILDTYDDIFSDFDPRSLDQRALSDDFLMEIRRATKEKKEGIIELNFLIPLEQRKSEKEAMIRKRLREHFRKHFEAIERDIKKVRKQGATIALVGFVLGVFGALFVVPSGTSTNVFIEGFQRIALVLIEPAAWFAIWSGFDKMFATWKELEPDLEFYKKMSKSEINFTGY